MVCRPRLVCGYLVILHLFILKFLLYSIWDEEHFTEQHHGKYWCVYHSRCVIHGCLGMALTSIS